MSPLQRGGRVILLAEDEPLVRNVVRHVLTTMGFHVIDAADGQEALELSRRFPDPIDMLLTDIRMPHVDGVELARVLHAERPETRILIMSAESSTQLAAIADGSNFIRKPFLPMVLRNKISDLMSKPPSTEETA